MSENKSKAEKKITVTLEEGIAKFPNADEVKAAIAAGTVSATLDTVEIESGKFSGDYVRLDLGPNAKTDAEIVEALRVICGGSIFNAPEADDKGVVKDSRKPSLVKFALYGSDLNARSRTSQQIKAQAVSPDKTIAKMVDNMLKMKPTLTREAAESMVRMMLED